jgi:hypothetical protein
MRIIRVLAVVIAITLGMGALPVGAQPYGMSKVPSIHTIKLTYWPTSVTTTMGGAANWSTTMLVFDYQFNLPNSLWGFKFEYGTGAQGSWGGASSGASGGTDTIWSADVTYTWEVRQFLLTGFVGYGSLKWETTLPAGTERFTSAGARIGVDALLPFYVSPNGSNLAITASAAWYPSNSTTFLSGGTTTTGTGSATDWAVGLRYKWGREIFGTTPMSDPGYLLTTLPDGLDTSWAAIIAYRSLGTGSGWSGLIVSVSKSF